jgi:L-iditol 2-dehydrogenase
LHGVRDLRLEKLPRPTLGPGEVLLKIASVGVCGSDVHYYLHGRIGSQVVTDPIIMGHEFSAWVVRLGDGASDRAPVARVAVTGLVHRLRCCLPGGQDFHRN